MGWRVLKLVGDSRAAHKYINKEEEWAGTREI